jgi:hypothetical protein
MLIGYYIILVFWIYGLVMRRNVYFVVWELVFAEIFKEICIPRAVKMDVGVVGVFGLGTLVGKA